MCFLIVFWERRSLLVIVSRDKLVRFAGLEGSVCFRGVLKIYGR